MAAHWRQGAGIGMTGVVVNLNANPVPPGLTEDRLLGGRVVLRQPADGLRAAIDAVLLAAAVPAEPGEAVLDIGTGTGAAAMCLATRCPGVKVTGIDIQRDLIRLLGDNATLNRLDDRVAGVIGDIANPPPRLSPGSFDHIMANPPYLEAGTGTLPPSPGKAMAVGEGSADLKTWVRFALAMVRNRGTITFVHRADRLDALLGEISGKAGEITLFPFWPGDGRPAKRVIVRARRGIATPTRLLPGMVLHLADGRFTAAADAILRDAAALELV